MQHNEEAMQADCVRWFGMQYYKLRRALVHVPNGGRRNAREGARFKRMGVQAGVPDLLLFIPNGGYNGLAMELKTPTGKLTKGQQEYREILRRCGWCYAVVRSFDEFREAVNGYLESFIRRNAWGDATE